MDEELQYQGALKKKDKGNIQTLEKKMKEVEDLWSNHLMFAFPKLREARRINQIGETLQEKLYVPLLNASSGYNATRAIKESTERKLLEFEIKEGEGNIPRFVQEEFMKAKKWVLTAYKEWEADRILHLVTNEQNYLILRHEGIASTAADRKKRYKELQMLLHTDKNVGVPDIYLNKIKEAGQYLTLD